MTNDINDDRRPNGRPFDRVLAKNRFRKVMRSLLVGSTKQVETNHHSESCTNIMLVDCVKLIFHWQLSFTARTWWIDPFLFHCRCFSAFPGTTSKRIFLTGVRYNFWGVCVGEGGDYLANQRKDKKGKMRRVVYPIMLLQKKTKRQKHDAQRRTWVQAKQNKIKQKTNRQKQTNNNKKDILRRIEINSHKAVVHGKKEKKYGQKNPVRNCLLHHCDDEKYLPKRSMTGLNTSSL